MISINELYQYIFGTRAIINLEKVPLEKRDARKIEIEHKIRKDFEDILKSDDGSFRQVLRVLQATNLEVILYGNNTDDIPAINIFPTDDEIKQSFNIFPTDDEIKQSFIKLNNQYQYLDTNDANEANYVMLFKACKLFSRYIERIDFITDETCYLNAYKMYTLFGIGNERNHFIAFEEYVSNFNFNNSRAPLHDVFLGDISENRPPIHLKQWREFVLKYGPTATVLFPWAPKINEMLGRDPLSLEEAKLCRTQLLYKRFDEYPELGKVCHVYSVKEEIFNQCLKIDKYRKRRDNLPDVMINGKDLGHPGYFLVKLPIDDPRAYILGKITNCCMSIGGESENCIIDGITRENNGFYVLLKQQKASANASPFTVDNKINYSNFSIVGTGYTWISQLGNLVIDSWENLRPENDDAVITPMIRQFAQVVTRNPKSNITRVTIGMGGKTPLALQENPLNRNTRMEKLKEGTPYGDALFQALIHMDPTKSQMVNSELKLLMNELKNNGFFSFMDEHNFLEILSREGFESSLAGITALRRILRDKKCITFINENQDIPFSYNILMLMQLEDAEILTSENLLILSTTPTINPNDILKIVTAMCTLNQAGLLTLEHKQTISRHPIYALKIAQALKALNQRGLLTHEYKETISNDPSDIFKIQTALDTLDEVGLLTPENAQLIILKNSQYAPIVSEAICALNEARLLTLEHKQIVSEHPIYALKIVQSLKVLNQRGLLTDEYIKTISSHPQYVDRIASAMVLLDEIKLLTPENAQLISEKAAYALDIAKALQMLNRHEILTAEHKHFIVKYPAYASAIADGFCTLDQAGLLSSEHIQLIDKHTEHTRGMVNALTTLSRANLLTSEHKELISNHARNASSIATAIVKLNEAKLLNSVYIIQMIVNKNPRNASDIASCLIELSKAGIEIDEGIYKMAINFDFRGSTIVSTIIEPLVLLNKRGLLTDQVKEVFTKIHLSTPLLNNILALDTAMILSTETLDAILKDPQYISDSITEGLILLKKSEALTQENIKLMLAEPKKARYTARLFSILENAEAVRKFLSDFPLNSDEFDQIFATFSNLLLLTTKPKQEVFLQAAKLKHYDSRLMKNLIERKVVLSDLAFKKFVQISQSSIFVSENNMICEFFLKKSPLDNAVVNAILESSSPRETISALVFLEDHEKSDPSILSLMKEYPQICQTIINNKGLPIELMEVIKIVKESPLISNDNKEYLTKSSDSFISLFDHINRAFRILFKLQFIEILKIIDDLKFQSSAICDKIIERLPDAFHHIYRSPRLDRDEAFRELKKLIFNIKKLENYIENRRDKGQYTGTRLGYSEAQKIESAKDLINCLTESFSSIGSIYADHRQGIFFTNSKRISILQSGKLKEASKEAIEYLKSKKF